MSAQPHKPKTPLSPSTTSSSIDGSTTSTNSSGGVAKAPSSASSYTPTYMAPLSSGAQAPAAAAQPATTVENNVTLPDAVHVATLRDIVDRIEANAHVLYPIHPRLRVTTAIAPCTSTSTSAQTSSSSKQQQQQQQQCHALVVTPKNAESSSSRFKVLLRGKAVVIGAAGGSAASALGRREALEALLDEVERRMGREMFA